ncbi:MAG: ATP-binding protein [Thermoanaerobaculia bacterium]
MSGERSPSKEFDSGDLIVRVLHKLPADVNLISPVVEEIIKVVKEMGCAEGQEFDIELALREALSNAIKHGGKNDPSKLIECCVACDRERGMLIIVRDPGRGFDPKDLPSPLHGENLFSTHGRGIFLINQLMDEVRFEKGGTEIHMIKRLKSPGNGGGR